MDNWGWCTGTCTAGADDTEGCYTGYHDDAPGDQQDECNIEDCPSEGVSGSCLDGTVPGSVVNPWINYDGAIRILAE